MEKKKNKITTVCIALNKFYKIFRDDKVIGFVSAKDTDKGLRFRAYSRTGTSLGRDRVSLPHTLEKAIKKLT